MIIELEINGARVIISGDNLAVNVSEGNEPTGHHTLPLPTSDLITALRRSLGMNQGELSDFLGVSQAAVCRWERGEREPRGPMAVKLATLISKHIDKAGASS